MGAMDDQLGVKSESSYNVPVVVDRFFEFESESIADTYGRTEGDPLRVGSGFVRQDRFTPYYAGAAGSLQMTVMSKGFGWWLAHMLGAVSTGAVGTDGQYVHTGTEGTLFGKSFTLQVNRPFRPSGTNQPFTFAGGKVAEWTLSNSVDGNLLLDLGLDFASVATDTALATAAYPSSMEPFSWAGGYVTIGGSNYDVTEVSIQASNGLDVDRRQIRSNTAKKEPTAARREGSFSISADFDSLTQRNRAAAVTRAGALASITAVWVAPTAIGGSTYPKVEVTIPAARFDEWSGAREGTDAITQSLSGAIRYNGSASPITIAYTSADSVA